MYVTNCSNEIYYVYLAVFFLPFFLSTSSLFVRVFLHVNSMHCCCFFTQVVRSSNLVVLLNILLSFYLTLFDEWIHFALVK
jgi:hypothetical protein